MLGPSSDALHFAHFSVQGPLSKQCWTVGLNCVDRSSSSAAILAQGHGGISSGPISFLLVHFCTKRSLSFMSQSWCCIGCGTWNWLSRPSCHNCGQTPNASNGSSWVQVVKKGKTSGQGKGVHIKQQAKQQSNGVQAGSSPDTNISGEKLVNVKQLHAQIAAVSRALAELDLWRQRADATRLAELGCMEQDGSVNRSTDCVE